MIDNILGQLKFSTETFAAILDDDEKRQFCEAVVAADKALGRSKKAAPYRARLFREFNAVLGLDIDSFAPPVAVTSAQTAQGQKQKQEGKEEEVA